jgi:hypothetical protein
MPIGYSPNAEWVDWLAKRQERLKIVKTTTTKPGRMVDWVPIESQVPSGKIASPPPNELLRIKPTHVFEHGMDGRASRWS